jgi:hypothetical protein
VTFSEVEVDGPAWEGPAVALDEPESGRSRVKVGVTLGGLSAMNKASCTELGEGRPVEGIPEDPGDGDPIRVSMACWEFPDSESESRTTIAARKNEVDQPTATDTGIRKLRTL